MTNVRDPHSPTLFRQSNTPSSFSCQEPLLRERGYEPREAGSGDIRLANCPFHALVEDHRELVCGMNLALADGLLDGLGGDELARLDPQPGQCCVAIGPLEGQSEKALKELGDQ